MMLNIKALIAAGAFTMCACLPVTSNAAVTVLDFEGRDGTGVILEDGYGGVTWNGGFRTYDTATTPYTPRSGTTVAYFNYDLAPPPTTSTLGFNFAAPVLFEGAWFAGALGETITFEYLLNGQSLGFVHTGSILSATPQLLGGFNKAVDEVRISARAGMFVFDDLTFNTDTTVSAVPEPSTWALLILGFFGVGSTLRSARRRTNGAASA